MRKRWVFLLAALAFAVGASWSLVRIGRAGSNTTMRIACELLETADTSSILTREQRNDVVERVQRKLQSYSGDGDKKAAEWIGQQFRAGCPILLGR
jgi:hypothetical protein